MADDQPKKPARGFDVRTVIGLLLGVYGVVLLLMGLFATSEEELTKADGVNLNLWTGLALLATSAVFLVWVRLRPLVVPATADHELRAEGTEGAAPSDATLPDR